MMRKLKWILRQGYLHTVCSTGEIPHTIVGTA